MTKLVSLASMHFASYREWVRVVCNKLEVWVFRYISSATVKALESWIGEDTNWRWKIYENGKISRKYGMSVSMGWTVPANMHPADHMSMVVE